MHTKHIHTYIRTYIHTYIHTYVHTHLRAHIPNYIIHTNTYTCIHTHTHTQCGKNAKLEIIKVAVNRVITDFSNARFCCYSSTQQRVKFS